MNFLKSIFSLSKQIFCADSMCFFYSVVIKTIIIVAYLLIFLFLYVYINNNLVYDLILATIFSIICIYLVCKILIFTKDYLYYWYKTIINDKNCYYDSLFNKNKTCVLIDGPIGSGKTYYYKNKIKPYINRPIYISCFSADKEQLISQVLRERVLINILSLHGVLNSFLFNNWQSYMPKKRIIVFDDLERLHQEESNYLDLIGIIGYLKDQKQCKIILIADLEKINSEIVNGYLEKIVDDIISLPKVDLKNILEPNQKDLSPIYNEFFGQLNSIYQGDFAVNISNIRIIKTVYNRIKSNELIKKHESENDERIKILIAKFMNKNLVTTIMLHYLYFKNHKLFTEAVKFSVGLIGIDSERAELMHLIKEESENTLSLDQFGGGAYRHNKSALLRDSFNIDENKLVMYAFRNIGDFVNYENTYDKLYILIEKLVGHLKTNAVLNEISTFNNESIETQIKNHNYLAEEINFFNKIKSNPNNSKFLKNLKSWREYILSKGEYIDKIMKNNNDWMPNTTISNTGEPKESILAKYFFLLSIFDKYKKNDFVEQTENKVNEFISNVTAASISFRIVYKNELIYLIDHFLWFYNEEKELVDILNDMLEEIYKQKNKFNFDKHEGTTN